MQTSRGVSQEFMYNNTFSQNFSLGFHGHIFENLKILSTNIALLPLRQNEEGRQTNCYATLGFGAATLAKQKNTPISIFPSALFILDTDTETRDTYFALKSMFLKILRKGNKVFFHSAYVEATARAGFSPYLASYGGLHAFLLGELYWNNREKKTSLTPIVRLFHQNLLLELGFSLEGNAKFTWQTEI
jgi:hypothetical protein